MEAQAELIADYFLLLRFGDLGSRFLSEEKYRGQGIADLIPRYKAVLADFIFNPHDDRNLPGRRMRHINQRHGRSSEKGGGL